MQEQRKNGEKKFRGTLIASPVLLCLVSSYFFFFELDFFFEAFLVAIVLFSLSILQSS
jgi:hypothetical protein